MLMNMKELLAVANEHNFAIPAFNIGTGQMLTGIIAECEAQKSPVILAIHPLELKFQQSVIVSWIGCGLTEQICVNINSFQDAA